MSLEHLNKLEKIANSLVAGNGVRWLAAHEGRDFFMEYKGIVVAKERARSAKGGHHYTPPETRKFEADVKKQAQERMKQLGITRFYRYCAVHLEITDDIPPDWPWWKKRLATDNMIFDQTGGDLDNKEKAILDALNKVVFDDDRLVVQVYKFRNYGETTGFKIAVTQTGLTTNDLDSVEKFIGGRNAPQEARR